MDTLDWEDLWSRLKGMVWSAAILGFSGLGAGLWIYGLAMQNNHTYSPQAYQDLYAPSFPQEGLRTLISWLHGTPLLEALVLLPWACGTVWLLLLPELPRRRRLPAALAIAVGLVVAWGIDEWLGWGAADLWVRFGAWVGSVIFLGTGLVLGERGKPLLVRTIRGGLAGGVIGLACVYAAQVAILGYVGGISVAGWTVLAPTVCGLVIGLCLSGADLFFAGSVSLREQWRRYWPLALLVMAVLLNALGPVLLVQHWYINGEL
ncbi:MAG: hypothetical protein IT369_22175 [Candidatus Latescibacteria bacterium]|nr:hypothetical protein [Candidatus Latescibacterota bacterium]